MSNRFLRLKLKADPLQAMSTLSSEEIDVVKRQLCELFPNMDLEKLQI